MPSSPESHDNGTCHLIQQDRTARYPSPAGHLAGTQGYAYDRTQGTLRDSSSVANSRSTPKKSLAYHGRRMSRAPRDQFPVPSHWSYMGGARCRPLGPLYKLTTQAYQSPIHDDKGFGAAGMFSADCCHFAMHCTACYAACIGTLPTVGTDIVPGKLALAAISAITRT